MMMRFKALQSIFCPLIQHYMNIYVQHTSVFFSLGNLPKERFYLGQKVQTCDYEPTHKKVNLPKFFEERGVKYAIKGPGGNHADSHAFSARAENARRMRIEYAKNTRRIPGEYASALRVLSAYFPRILRALKN